MPSQTPLIGTRYDVYVPTVDELIALGYTHIRVFQEANETDAVGAADTSILLVSGTFDYSYNKTDGLQTDWAEHCWFGAVPGEGPHTERVPLDRPRSTRLQIRQGVGRRLRKMELATVLTSASGTNFVSSRLIDPDASTARYASWFSRPSTGAFAGATRRIRTAANSGYTIATGEIVVGRTYGGALTAGDIVELWRPHGDEDPSEIVDEAISDARINIWMEETWIFSVDTSTTEYTMPDGCNEYTIAKVEWLAGTFPDDPKWRPVGGYDVTGNNITITRELGREFSGGDLIRVTYAAMGDRLQSDADYWDVDLQWAICEGALAYLARIGKPGGKEEAIEHERTRSGLLQEQQILRRVHMPKIRMKVIGVR